MVWNDIFNMIYLKNFWTYFKFWRVYDLTMHILLSVALLSKGFRSFGEYSYKSYIDHQCSDRSGIETCENIKNWRNFLDDMEGAFLALAATQSMLRLIYWLQLHPKVGPIGQ